MFVIVVFFVWTLGRVASVSTLANGDSHKILNPKPQCIASYSTGNAMPLLTVL